MRIIARFLSLPLCVALTAASAVAPAQTVPSAAPVVPAVRTASSAPTPEVTAAGARNCPRPGGGTVTYSNCTDHDGPGQGELQLKRVESLELSLAKPDLALLPLLRLGGETGAWDGELHIPSVTVVNGTCLLSLRIGVINDSQQTSEATRHVLRQRPSRSSGHPGRTLGVLQQPALEPGETRTFELNVQLSGGTSWVQVELDSDDSVNESNEGNNRGRVQIQLDPACG